MRTKALLAALASTGLIILPSTTMAEETKVDTTVYLIVRYIPTDMWTEIEKNKKNYGTPAMVVIPELPVSKFTFHPCSNRVIS